MSSRSPLLAPANVALVLSLLATCSSPARADDDEETGRPPLPEPIFTESVTDLDGADEGEVEVEMNASSLRARGGGASVTATSVEVEWLATRRLGFRAEPSFASERAVDGGRRGAWSGTGAASFKLLQDFEHDFHIQAELSGRLPFDVPTLLSPGDAQLPAAADLRAGLRVERFTFRGAVGGEAGGSPAHVPLRASGSILTGMDAQSRFGFFGIEADVDGARKHPVVLAANIVADAIPAGLPFRIGVATPVLLGATGREPSIGIFVRLFFVSAREVEFGKTGK